MSDLISHPLGPGRFRPRVHVADGKAFVFDAASAASLLSEHRIWATPVGVRPARNKSPEHNFPCVLSQEQATLIIRRDLADVYLGHPRGVSEESFVPHRRPGAADITSDHGDAGAPASTPALATSGSGLDDAPSTLGLEWNFPQTLAENKSMAVFEDLWARGLCVAGGSNYGADYVVYDGPPTERHSVAGIVVSRGSNDELSPAEVSGFARVQQAVAKKAVIATAPRVEAAAVAVAPARDTGSIAADNETSTDRRAAADGVRYVTLQFHSVSSRA